jgi:hypothetical protein
MHAVMMACKLLIIWILGVDNLVRPFRTAWTSILLRTDKSQPFSHISLQQEIMSYNPIICFGASEWGSSSTGEEEFVMKQGSIPGFLHASQCLRVTGHERGRSYSS